MAVGVDRWCEASVYCYRGAVLSSAAWCERDGVARPRGQQLLGVAVGQDLLKCYHIPSHTGVDRVHEEFYCADGCLLGIPGPEM